MTPSEIAAYHAEAAKLLQEQVQDMYDDLEPQDYFNQTWKSIKKYGGYNGDIDDLIDAFMEEEDEYAYT